MIGIDHANEESGLVQKLAGDVAGDAAALRRRRAWLYTSAIVGLASTVVLGIASGVLQLLARGYASLPRVTGIDVPDGLFVTVRAVTAEAQPFGSVVDQMSSMVGQCMMFLVPGIAGLFGIIALLRYFTGKSDNAMPAVMALVAGAALMATGSQMFGGFGGSTPRDDPPPADVSAWNDWLIGHPERADTEQGRYVLAQIQAIQSSSRLPETVRGLLRGRRSISPWMERDTVIALASAAGVTGAFPVVTQAIQSRAETSKRLGDAGVAGSAATAAVLSAALLALLLRRGMTRTLQRAEKHLPRKHVDQTAPS